MTFRTPLLTLAALISGATANAGAQSTNAPTTYELAPVTITAPEHGTFYRIAHIEEERKYVLGLMAQNRRLTADLRRADEKVAQLEGRLVEVRADHDRRVADIAAIDSAAADTRRKRVELEQKLRRVDPAAAQDNGTDS
jgi:hypothetical protein